MREGEGGKKKGRRREGRSGDDLIIPGRVRAVESRRSVQFVSVYVIYCSRLTERPRRRAARTGRSSGGGTDDDGGAGATQPSPWAGGGGVAPGRCWLPSPRAGGSAGLCCLACRRPGPVPAAIATGWQRCRHGPPGRHRRAKLRAMCSPSPCREQGGGLRCRSSRRRTVQQK